MLQLNCVSADSNAHKAAIAAYYSNKQQAMLYTTAQKTQAQCALDILHCAFAYANSYINYRKKFIAVKITSYIAHDNATAQNAISILQEKGYTVVTTKQGLIVRITK